MPFLLEKYCFGILPNALRNIAIKLLGEAYAKESETSVTEIYFAKINHVQVVTCGRQRKKLSPVSDRKALRNVRGDIAANDADSSKLLFIEGLSIIVLATLVTLSVFGIGKCSASSGASLISLQIIFAISLVSLGFFIWRGLIYSSVVKFKVF